MSATTKADASRTPRLDALIRSADLLSLLGWQDKKPEASIDGGEYAGACPRCGGYDRLRAWPHSDRPRFWCPKCEWSGRSLDLVMHLERLSLPRAIEWLERYSGTPRALARLAPPAAPKPRDAAPNEHALSIWDESRDAGGTVVERYLRSRGITIRIPDSLRFHPNLWHGKTEQRHPAMVAAVVRFGTGMVAVHRTFFTAEGRKVATSPKTMLGPVWGAAVQLAPAGSRLAVCEGLETGLSVQQDTLLPVWAALSSSGYDSLILPPLPLAAEVVIAADHDAPEPVMEGRRPATRPIEHAYRAAARWTREGRVVRVAMPPNEGDDFNDLLQRSTR